MAAEARQEELEVYAMTPEALLPSKIDDDELTVRIEPEEGTLLEPMLLLLRIRYTPDYPDELPDISIDVEEEGPEEDALTDDDKAKLKERLVECGQENIGIAMVYTLAMQLKESLTELLVAKAAARELEEQTRMLKMQEAEMAKPKGTPVTKENFLSWKKKFDIEMREKRKKEQEEELKALLPKERREKEAFVHRLTGRQIFEYKRNLDDDTETGDEDGVEIDITSYDREQRHDDDEDEQEGGLVLSDSD